MTLVSQQLSLNLAAQHLTFYLLHCSVGRLLKYMWDKEPVITVSCAIGVAGECEINVPYEYSSTAF